MNKLSKVILGLSLLVMSAQGFAMDNPYAEAKVDRVEAQVVEEFNRFQFLESVAVDSKGVIYTTSAFEGAVFRVANGVTTKLHQIPGVLAGLELLDDNNLLISGTNDKKQGVVLKVNTSTGDSEVLGVFPEAMFLNGILKVNNNTVLIADTFKGVIWKLNPQNGKVSVWLKHELLASPNLQNMEPGANGLELNNNTVYFSNSNKMLVGKVKINRNGSAGGVETVAENVFIDDFTMDKNANIYAASNLFDNVVKISKDGEVTILAQLDQGVSGSTDVTWAHGSDDTLLISANGGMLKQDKSQITTAKIVELKLK